MEKFWKKYIKSGSLQRGKKLKNVTQVIDKLKDIKDEQLRLSITSTQLQSYFDDLISVMSTKRVKK